jgi:hypothetical protein
MSQSTVKEIPIAERFQIIRKQRLLADYNTPDQLISWLNTGRKGPAKTRIIRVVELLQQQKALSSWATGRTEADRARMLKLLKPGPTGNPIELDDLLARYWISPRVFFLSEGPRMLYVIPDDTSRDQGKAGPDEVSAAMCVLRLAECDELDRVRKCTCGKFFSAGRIDQIYCRAKCRVRYHQSSETFKAKRRKYLRDLYRLKQSGKVK